VNLALSRIAWGAFGFVVLALAGSFVYEYLFLDAVHPACTA